jgi:hypothetical protein
MTEQTIDVPMKVGSRVSVLTDVDLEEGGSSGSIVFEDTVVQYVPSAGKLEFADSDIRYAEFKELLAEYDSVQVMRE